MTKQSIDLHELFQYVLLEAHAAWRYRWHALAVAWAIAIVGTLVVFAIPNQYESKAQVYADTAALTNPLLHGIAVQPDMRGRLDIITHTLLARPNVEKVADQTGLALRATTPAAREGLLQKLGRSVKIRDAGARDLYNIHYANTDPKMAEKVVQAFVQILMNETLGTNAASTATAQNFLQQQVDDYATRLNQAEQDLAEYKKAHIGFIPKQGGSDYFTQLQAAQQKLQSLQDQYDVASSSRATTNNQMHGMVTNVASPGIDPRVRQINEQISDYQKQLNNLLLRYTDSYPDVIATRRMIKQLQGRREALEKKARNDAMEGVTTDNPVYQELQKNLYATQVTMRTLGTQIALQKQRIAELKKNAAKTTDVQATLQGLTRNYTATKTQYNELITRLNTAKMSQAAAQSGNNLKFRIVDPPDVPLSPTSPKRGLLLILVFLFAIGLGGAFGYFLHKIKPVFMSLKSLHDFGDYPVIGTFSLIVSRVRRERRRREIVGFCAGVGLLVVVLVASFALHGPLARIVQHVYVLGVL